MHATMATTAVRVGVTLFQVLLRVLRRKQALPCACHRITGYPATRVKLLGWCLVVLPLRMNLESARKVLHTQQRPQGHQRDERLPFARTPVHLGFSTLSGMSQMGKVWDHMWSSGPSVLSTAGPKVWTQTWGPLGEFDPSLQTASFRSAPCHLLPSQQPTHSYFC